jgi:hypothetical protein
LFLVTTHTRAHVTASRETVVIRANALAEATFEARWMKTSAASACPESEWAIPRAEPAQGMATDTECLLPMAFLTGHRVPSCIDGVMVNVIGWMEGEGRGLAHVASPTLGLAVTGLTTGGFGLGRGTMAARKITHMGQACTNPGVWL